jgi:hypothetical protein
MSPSRRGYVSNKSPLPKILGSAVAVKCRSSLFLSSDFIFEKDLLPARCGVLVLFVRIALRIGIKKTNTGKRWRRIVWNIIANCGNNI